MWPARCIEPVLSHLQDEDDSTSFVGLRWRWNEMICTGFLAYGGHSRRWCCNHKTGTDSAFSECGADCVKVGISSWASNWTSKGVETWLGRSGHGKQNRSVGARKEEAWGCWWQMKAGPNCCCWLILVLSLPTPGIQYGTLLYSIML